jgi:multiple sugar transport system ATP-binding protein
MRIELAKLHKQLGCTMIYVTHDQVEAMTMADKIVVLDNGFVAQVGTPLDIYHYPKNIFVAGFIGSPKMNFINVLIQTVEEKQVEILLPNCKTFWIPIDGSTVTAGSEMTLGIRPEHLVSLEQADAVVEGDIVVVEKLGHETQVYLHIEGSEDDVIYRVPDTLSVDAGEKFNIGIPANRCHLFHQDGVACQRLHPEVTS